MKHTSTVLEPSIPFHTLVKLADAEDKENDEIRTLYLTLEVNVVTNQLQSQNLETQQSEHPLITQPRDPNNKHNPAFEKYCSFCHRTNHSISACFKKQRDDEDKRDVCSRSGSPQKSFVQDFRSSSPENNSYKTNNKPTQSYDRYRSRCPSRHSNTNRNISSQNRYRSHSRDRYSYDRTPTSPQFNRSRYDNYRLHPRSHRSPYRSSYRLPYRQDSSHRYRPRSYSRDRQFSHYFSSNRPPF